MSGGRTPMVGSFRAAAGSPRCGAGITSTKILVSKIFMV